MHRPRIALTALVGALTLGFAAHLAPAAAFELPIHQRIVIDALSGQTSGEAANAIIRGNKESDIHQMAAEHHFDSAKNPQDICDEWGRGFQSYMTEAVKSAAPKGPWKRELQDRENALFRFGSASHAVQDFYSHSNWIEYHVAGNLNGQMPPAAPIVGNSCNAGAFPPEINSGYASVIWFAVQFGHSWCGPLGAPNGYEECHDTLSKDDPEKGHGAQGPDLHHEHPTYHEVAVQMAAADTRRAWDELHRRVVTAYTDATTDGECVWRKLAWGGDESCLKRFALKVTEVLESNGQGLGSPNGLATTYRHNLIADLAVVEQPEKIPGWSLLSGTAQGRAREFIAEAGTKRVIAGVGATTLTLSSQLDGCSGQVTTNYPIFVILTQTEGESFVYNAYYLEPDLQSGPWSCTNIQGRTRVVESKLIIPVSVGGFHITDVVVKRSDEPVHRSVRTEYNFDQETIDLQLSPPAAAR